MSDDAQTTTVTQSTRYTRTGDDGTSALGDLSQTPKTDTRLVSYGDCEEASGAIGMALALAPGLPDGVVTALVRVQNDLLDLGADLCAPMGERDVPAPRIDDGYIARLERACDHFEQDLPPLPGFILPGGTSTAALLHNARNTVRRAERAVWAALREHPTSMNPATGRYLNRLATLLFILARGENAEHGDTLWQAGLSAAEPDAELWERPAV